MLDLTLDSAIKAGGWDPRYAVILAVASQDNIGAALIDPNGDGGDIDLDQYIRGSDGHWAEAGSSGGAGDEGASWSPEMVTTYGRSDPNAQVRIAYTDQTYTVHASSTGWWLFIAPTVDENTMPVIRPSDSSC